MPLDALKFKSAKRRLEGKTGRLLLQSEAPRVCSHCHFRNRPKARFCSQCGASI
ncbi:TPA: zinc-ribbon domain-containing protein [Candidatus Poribacteria bacterium]|nr:zinc-ribbon domain-containing protein [Candidatus Poribacteria bacterium]